MKTIKLYDILLPATADMKYWAVNACDQFTSDYAYWEEVERITKGKPSTFNLIFPEIYLKDNPEKRIAAANAAMDKYLKEGVFKKVQGGFILVERATESGTRTGLVMAIDLEDYSFEKGAKTPIRSTEATILERIPPRVEIRKNAPVELPHIMLLYNDPKDAVLKSCELGEVLYDFDLMMNGGHIKGTYVKNAEKVIEKFYSLVADKADKFLFAVGDGNHSLATAKTCWENLKPTLSDAEKENHPARFALVEAVNIFDKALNFEPIHRLVKISNPEKFAKGLKIEGKGSALLAIGGKTQKIPFPEDIPAGIRLLDNYITEFLKENGGEVDYIHGDKELIGFTKEGGAGIILPPIQKGDFFDLISKGGNLPRKTFSMGEGNEKRYYIEAKLIK